MDLFGIRKRHDQRIKRILDVLEHSNLTAIEISDAIAKKFGDRYRMRSGTLESLLNELEREDKIISRWNNEGPYPRKLRYLLIKLGRD
jgi:DNA-binding PadR family transcriptional regulator